MLNVHVIDHPSSRLDLYMNIISDTLYTICRLYMTVRTMSTVQVIEHPSSRRAAGGRSGAAGARGAAGRNITRLGSDEEEPAGMNAHECT